VRILFVLAALTLAPQDDGVVEFTLKDNPAVVPFRIHLQPDGGKPIQPPGVPFWKDHFIANGSILLHLSPGMYSVAVERGPEFSAESLALSVEAGKESGVQGSLRRLANPAAEGWWSGDLHVHRPLADIELLMKAEDLHVAPVITWWNDRNLWEGRELPKAPVVAFDSDRFYSVMAGEDEREGGALMYYGLPKPMAIKGAAREYPSPVKFLLEAKQAPGVHVDIEKPFWWDTPTWIATGKIDTIGIAVNHMCRSTMMEKEAWGKPRPADRLPPPLGVGHWVQEIYYHVLNTGLRIAPSAGSASGVLPNPVGYNRVYVHLDGDLSYGKWFEGLRAGRSFVTNGPLLRVKANGELPGHVFTAEKSISIDLAAALDSRDSVDRIEIVRNGRVERQVPTQEPLGKIEFTSSGWFLVRCFAKNEQTFRFASTAPYYVEIGAEKRRISRASARFFADWVDERMSRVPLKLKDEKQLEEVLEPHRRAKEFWVDLAARANAE